MNYQLKCQKARSTREVLSTVLRQPIDLDLTLPDYCADIEKILKCSVTVRITGRTLSGGQLNIDGMTLLRILYCDSDRGVLRCCEQSVPFSTEIAVNEQTNDNIILTDCKTEYLNCRALTPRRLDIHGAFSINVRVLSSTFDDLYTCDGSDDLQARAQSLDVCELSVFSQDDFSVSETVALPPKSNVESIIRSELKCGAIDITPSGERMLIKGEMTLRLFYMCDSKTGETDQFVYSFPFSQMVSPGSSEAELCDVRLDILSYDIVVRSDAVSETPKITVDAKLSAALIGYTKTAYSYISDVYSTEYRTEAEYENCNLCTDISIKTLNIISKSTVSLGEAPVQKIVDIFCEDVSAYADVTDNRLSLTGKLNACILAANDSGELVFVERAVEFAGEEVSDGSYMLAKVNEIAVKSLSYRICDNNELELRLEICAKAELCSNSEIRTVCSVEAVGEPLDKSDRSAITLYYALEGEKLWDISKRYTADYKLCLDENSLVSDELEQDTMLLIMNM